MPIVGISFHSIEAKRNSLPQGEIKISPTPKILEIKEVSMPGLDKKTIDIKFEFVTDYQPNIGRIRLEGGLAYMADNNEKLMAHWKKNKSLIEEASVEVFSFLFEKCLLVAWNIANYVQLLPPLQLPKVVMKAKETQEKNEKAK